jgi:hypothetical protein
MVAAPRAIADHHRAPEIAAVFNRLAPLIIAVVLGVAGTLAWLGIGRDRTPNPSLREAPAESPTTTVEGTLPPDHPPIGGGSPMNPDMPLPPNHPPIGGSSPHGAMPAPLNEAPTLSWKMPGDWQETPNPSALRLATYHVPGEAEMIVARAGGSTEANIQRWLSQFDNAGADTRDERTIRGLHVTLVQVAGTFAPSPMMTAGAAPQAHPGWALEGAIVETSGSPYFFKLIGPAPAIKSAQPSFERLLASLQPLEK